MPTFQVRCAECGGEKWPSLPERPTRYVCVLCMAVPANVRQRRREQGQKAAERAAAKKRPA